MLETRPGPWESGGTLVEKIQRIRTILKQHGRLARDAESLDEHADLYQAGMTSHASVNVMLALEGEFDVEFPDEMLKRSSFESIAAIASAVESLTANPA
ncbi:MAG TPA: acyl carrier protein [Rhodanobacteraceae bacterium]|nr:acyl carrier protein [Rhodanobacteraceae bacterium]